VETSISPLIPLAGCAVPLIGVGIAWVLHRSFFWRAQAGRTATPLARFLASACGFDFFYDAILVRPYLRLAAALRHDPVDRIFTGLADIAIFVHRRLRATQTGNLRRYATWMTAGAIATIAMVLFA
jgi:NADH-quinone oxidoreductase subunit L